MSREVKCPCGCGRTIAKVDGKNTTVWCKTCKKEVALPKLPDENNKKQG